MGELLDDEEVGRRLKAARALRGITNAEEFAAELRQRYKVAELAYAEYESGKRTLQGRDRLAVREALRIPDWWLTAPLETLLGPESEPTRIESVVQQLLLEMRVRVDQLGEQIEQRLERQFRSELQQPPEEHDADTDTTPSATTNHPADA